MRFRDDNAAELARARAAVAAWREQNPAGTSEDLLAAVGHQFHQDYGVVLRAVLFAVDRPSGASDHWRLSGGLSVSGGRSWLSRGSITPASDEFNQMLRLQAFRAAHPKVIIGDGGFGTTQARIPQPAGEIVITRYRLTELLDKLDDLIGGCRAQPDGDPG